MARSHRKEKLSQAAQPDAQSIVQPAAHSATQPNTQSTAQLNTKSATQPSTHTSAPATGILATLKKNAYLLAPILIVLAGIFLVSTMNRTIEHNRTSEAKSKAELSAKVYSTLLVSDIDKAINITNTLERHIVSNNGSLPQFENMTENLMADYIQSVQLAPGGVVTEIYPAEGNEAGLVDLINRDDERGAACRYARDNDTVVMQGPFELLQGGTGIAIRNPVYLDQDGQKSFWGFTIVIVRVPEIFEDSVSTLSDQGYNYRLSKVSSPTSSEYVEVCSSDNTVEDALVHEFEAGGISWKLELSPVGGWYNPSSTTMTSLVNMAFFISLAIIVFLVLRYNRRKEEQKRLVLAGNLERLENERALKNQVQMYATAMGVGYPLAINLDYTANSYQMIEYENALNKTAAQSGSIDGLIRAGAQSMPDKQQAAQFAELFGREQTIAAFRNGQSEITFSHKQLDDNGEVHWMETKVVCVECTDELVQGVAIARCIDEEVRNKELRIEAERANTAKTSFLRRMSHDVRTPINGIRGELYIAEQHPDDCEVQAECRKKMREASDYLISLANNILDMSKLESGKSELDYVAFDLEQTLSSVAGVASTLASEHSLRFIIDGNLDEVEHKRLIGSPKHLQQILSNLSGNAIKYTRPGGTVTVNCRELSYDHDTAWFEFSCADTGIGMSEEFQHRMYEPFAREERNGSTDVSGSGLGLAIVSELVEQMHGSVECESHENQGTIFRVRLPFDINHEAPCNTQANNIHVDVSGKRALLVEDNELNREIACFVLQQEGLEVDCAENGKVGADMFAASPEGTYDIVFMDVMMPVMDGLEATRTIRALERADAQRVPIVAMTANAFADDVQRSIDAGMNEHLAKPIEPAQIHETIQRLLA